MKVPKTQRQPFHVTTLIIKQSARMAEQSPVNPPVISRSHRELLVCLELQQPTTNVLVNLPNVAEARRLLASRQYAVADVKFDTKLTTAFTEDVIIKTTPTGTHLWMPSYCQLHKSIRFTEASARELGTELSLNPGCAYKASWKGCYESRPGVFVGGPNRYDYIVQRVITNEGHDLVTVKLLKYTPSMLE